MIAVLHSFASVVIGRHGLLVAVLKVVKNHSVCSGRFSVIGHHGLVGTVLRKRDILRGYASVVVGRQGKTDVTFAR